MHAYMCVYVCAWCLCVRVVTRVGYLCGVGVNLWLVVVCLYVCLLGSACFFVCQFSLFACRVSGPENWLLSHRFFCGSTRMRVCVGVSMAVQSGMSA